MEKLNHKLLDLYLNRYLKRHPHQLRKIEDFNFKPHSFLVISSTALGDTILSTPAIKSLHHSFPGARITALMHRNIMSLFEGFAYIDGVIPFYGGYKRFLETVRAIRRHSPDVVLIFHGNGPQDIALAILSGAKIILKHPTKSPYKRYLSYDFPQKIQHTIEDRLDLVRKTGGACFEKTLALPPLKETGKAEKVERILGRDSLVIGFQMGAANRYKMWPVERFILMAKKILASHKACRIAVTGNRKESGLAGQLVRACGTRVLNTCGLFKVEELPYLVRKFDLLLTNDTGTMHVAIALKVPTISLFSTSDSRIIGPYQDYHLHRVIQKDGRFMADIPKKVRDDRAMRLIEVDEVYAQYEDFMHHRPV